MHHHRGFPDGLRHYRFFLAYHLQNAKAHGVTRAEIAAIITHATMYVGWPKGWAVFRLAKEVWNEQE